MSRFGFEFLRGLATGPDPVDVGLEERGGKVTPFGQISPLTTALNQQLSFRRLHFNADYRAEVERAVAAG